MAEDLKPKLDWLRCPKCGGKTRTRIRAHTVLEDFPLFCPKCRQESMINVQSFQIEKQISRTLRRSAIRGNRFALRLLFLERIAKAYGNNAGLNRADHPAGEAIAPCAMRMNSSITLH